MGRVTSGVALGVALGICLASGSLAMAADCAALSKSGVFGPNVAVRGAKTVAADAASGALAFCEVTSTISPVPGSKIGAVYRLPENWNGRMLGIGGGGWAGNVTLAAALPGLQRGYATAQTDGGHESPNGGDPSWVKGNAVAVTDFSHRAVHEMTVLGKKVVTERYGKKADRDYFQGCSTGGRMALMEAQRYPDDYHGIIAGAPVYTLLTQTSPVIRHQIFAGAGASLTEAQLKRVNAAVVEACDANDGLKDGVITDPRRCNWNPSQLQCKAGQTADCLNAAQVKALQQAYETRRTSGGLVGNYGMTRGSEAGWGRFVAADQATELNAMNGGLGDLIPLIFPNGSYDATRFDPEKQQAAVHRTPFAREYEASSTDLKPFFTKGGKLIVWHGQDDPGPSPYATTDWVEKARKANGTQDFEYFVLPGVYHCRGGPGADEFDSLTAIESWVEKGQRPTRLVAGKANSPMKRPLCPWPQLPYYSGKGDANDAASFQCRAAP